MIHDKCQTLLDNYLEPILPTAMGALRHVTNENGHSIISCACVGRGHERDMKHLQHIPNLLLFSNLKPKKI